MIKQPKMRYALNSDTKEISRIKYGDYSESKYYQELFKDSRVLCHILLDGQGFIIKKVYKTHIEIIDLQVQKEFRRQKIGTSLINKVKMSLSEDFNKIICNVPETNLAFQLFLKNCGFTATVVKGKEEYQFSFVLDQAPALRKAA